MKAGQDKKVKLQTYDLHFFIDQSYFNNDGSQNYLIFQTIYKTITTFSVLTSTISEWESKGLSNEKFKPTYISNKSLSPKQLWNNSKIRLKFERNWLKQEDKAPFTPNNAVNLFIVYELDRWSRGINTYFTLEDCLFGAFKITKNADLDKYVYTSYGIGFDSRSEFSLPNGRWVKFSLFLELI